MAANRTTTSAEFQEPLAGLSQQRPDHGTGSDLKFNRWKFIPHIFAPIDPSRRMVSIKMVAVC